MPDYGRLTQERLPHALPLVSPLYPPPPWPLPGARILKLAFETDQDTVLNWLPPTLSRSSLQTKLVPPRCPQVFRRHSRWLSVREWRQLGVQPTGRGLPDGEMATLIEPDGQGAIAYLLTGNYRVILDYNCSNFYALSVGLLADAITG